MPTNPALEEELHHHLDHLPLAQQRLVLDFARALATAARPKGVPGNQLLRFAGAIPPDDLALMSRHIAQDCGAIDPHEWYTQRG